MSIALLSRRIDVASALLRVRAFAAAAAAAPAAASAAAAAPKAEKKAAEKEKKASRADKKAAKLSATSESGDAQWDAFNAPMIVQKEVCDVYLNHLTFWDFLLLGSIALRQL
jgi:transposase-like protein